MYRIADKAIINSIIYIVTILVLILSRFFIGKETFESIQKRKSIARSVEGFFSISHYAMRIEK